MNSSIQHQIRRWLAKNSALVALAFLFVLSSLIFPKFLTKLNLSAILKQYSIIGFLALAQMLITLTGGIDLSQGSMVAFTAVVTAVLLQTHGVLFSVACGLLAATALGLVSGFIISRTSMPPFIVTLGMLGIARGLALLVSDAKPISIEVESFVNFGKGTLLGIPTSAILWILASVLLYLFLTRRKLGRYIYATGGSEESARLSGINIRTVKLFVYSFGAFLTGIGGILWAARLRSGSPIGGVNYELESIAAILVGGGTLFGGVGTVTGTIAGVLIFGVVNSSLNMAGISPYWQGTLKGIIVLLAVVLSQIRRPAKNNR
jgi:ribose/xylose/arabinose/galactoside ABC-type transport system permease subunit